MVGQGAYHGDTMGAMDAVPPSAFNGFLQAPWCEQTSRSMAQCIPHIDGSQRHSRAWDTCTLTTSSLQTGTSSRADSHWMITLSDVS